MFCVEGYGTGTKAPLKVAPGVQDYLCAHTVLLAHARVYKMYKDDYQPKYPGKMGIVLNSHYTFPKNSNNAVDIAAADRSTQFNVSTSVLVNLKKSSFTSNFYMIAWMVFASDFQQRRWISANND